MILNQAQAEAVYGAMVAMNNIGMYADMQNEDVRVAQDEKGRVFVFGEGSERYPNQAAFAAAYSLS